jgi:aldehyde:ferredoxin oxidoreductase
MKSNVGGFGKLRAAGYDGLWITGKAEEPVYLWLNGNKLQVRKAAHLWGQDTYATQDKIKAELGEKVARVFTIGPAGEKQVLFASIMCDHGRMSGRTGKRGDGCQESQGDRGARHESDPGV